MALKDEQLTAPVLLSLCMLKVLYAGGRSFMILYSKDFN